MQGCRALGIGVWVLNNLYSCTTQGSGQFGVVALDPSYCPPLCFSSVLCSWGPYRKEPGKEASSYWLGTTLQAIRICFISENASDAGINVEGFFAKLFFAGAGSGDGAPITFFLVLVLSFISVGLSNLSVDNMRHELLKSTGDTGALSSEEAAGLAKNDASEDEPRVC